MMASFLLSTLRAILAVTAISGTVFGFNAGARTNLIRPAGTSGRLSFAATVRLSTMDKNSELPGKPPLPEGFYDESVFDQFCLAIFRLLVQGQTGFKSEKDGYTGLVEEAQQYMIDQRATVEDQQQMVKNILETAAGPAVPPVYRLFMAGPSPSGWPWAPALTAFFTPLFFKFLVGPNRADVREDGAIGGVYVERCRFLEETGCKGLCLNMCKVPTQEFFKETLGLDMLMKPNYETNECRLSFGIKPLPIEEDPDVPSGCLACCISKDAMANEKSLQKTLCGKPEQTVSS